MKSERMVRNEKREKVTLGGCRKRDRERLDRASFRAVGSRPKALGQGNRFINQKEGVPVSWRHTGFTARRRERETVRVRFPRLPIHSRAASGPFSRLASPLCSESHEATR